MYSEASRGILPVRFIIIGTTPAGLTSAIALRKAGHEVTVIETEDEATLAWRAVGVQIPPSMSKLLYRWPLRDGLKSLAVRVTDLILTKYEQEDVLGVHTWHEEILRDAGGDFSYVHMTDLRQLLYREAIASGAAIMKGQIASYDFDRENRPLVQLEAGTILEADIVVGTDPSDEVTRELVFDGDEPEENHHEAMTMFTVETPQSALRGAGLIEGDPTYAWLGPSHGALGFLSGRNTYTTLFYTTDPEADQYWGTWVDREVLLRFLGECSPRVRQVVESSTSVRCEALREPVDPPTTVDRSGRVLLIGDAAYPITGTVNAVSTSICDGFALGEFFKHLHTPKQIESFLLGFENIQRDRVRMMVRADLALVRTYVMPPGEEHDQRDLAMKQRHLAGGGLLQEEAEGAETWTDAVQTFAYDAEEHAAEWWNDWGLLQERAADEVCIGLDDVPPCSVGFLEPSPGPGHIELNHSFPALLSGLTVGQ